MRVALARFWMLGYFASLKLASGFLFLSYVSLGASRGGRDWPWWKGLKKSNQDGEA